MGTITSRKVLEQQFSDLDQALAAERYLKCIYDDSEEISDAPRREIYFGGRRKAELTIDIQCGHEDYSARIIEPPEGVPLVDIKSKLEEIARDSDKV